MLATLLLIFFILLFVAQHSIALQAHSDICKASGFVITTEPLGFVLTKQVNVFLLRVNEINSPSYTLLYEQNFLGECSLCRLILYKKGTIFRIRTCFLLTALGRLQQSIPALK